MSKALETLISGYIDNYFSQLLIFGWKHELKSVEEGIKIRIYSDAASAEYTIPMCALLYNKYDVVACVLQELLTELE